MPMIELPPRVIATTPVVILTGAGISRESGLETFRDPDGIWARHRIEDVATPEAFARDPDLVHRFYNTRRQGLLDPVVQPNAAHAALARLERAWPGDVTLVTQNIDDLHERGGSGAVVHMHGELLKARCAACGAVHPWRQDLSVDLACPSCRRVGNLRPDVVWFGEMPFALEIIGEALERCGLFIAIGTSGTVYPAAGLVQEARTVGAFTVELNAEPSETIGLFDAAEFGPATQTVPALVDLMLERCS